MCITCIITVLRTMFHTELSLKLYAGYKTSCNFFRGKKQEYRPSEDPKPSKKQKSEVKHYKGAKDSE